MRDEHIDKGIEAHGGIGVHYGLTVGHGASYAAVAMSGDRDECLTLLEKQMGVTADDEPYMTLNMPCGNTAIIQRKADFPTETMQCSCGNPNHWVVYFHYDDTK